MTTLRFRYPKDLLPAPLLHRTFFASWGRVPALSKIVLEDDMLIVHTEMPGSGTVHFPWPNKRLGVIFLCTETLCERERPYHLVKELARGQLGRLIRRFVELIYYGFKPNDLLRRTIRLEIARFATLATSNDLLPEINELAIESLNRLTRLSLTLNDMFLEQSLSFRKRMTPSFPVRLGIGVDTFFQENPIDHFNVYSDLLKDVFHQVNATPTWKELEPEPDVFRWDIFDERIDTLRKNGFAIIAGPIIKFDFRSIPGWVIARLDEGETFEKFALKYLDTFLEHFAHKVDLWILASRMNSQQLEHCPISRSMEMVKDFAGLFERHDLIQPGIVGVDQPWGDYLLHHDTPYTPFQIAETLSQLSGIDGILLEINFGLSSRCTYPRDPVTLSSMIDQWGFFGKPLYLSLGIPSELGSDPELPDEFVGYTFQWSRKTQQEWVHRSIPLLFSKRSIEGIIWNQLEDTSYSEHASSGLFDLVGRLKPAFRKLSSFRAAYVE